MLDNQDFGNRGSILHGRGFALGMTIIKQEPRGQRASGTRDSNPDKT